MKSRHLLYVAGLVLALVQAPALLVGQDQGVKADYDRANNLRARIADKVYGIAEAPNWLAGSKFWYRKSAKGGSQFVLVDAAAAARTPAFDHTKLASAISTSAGGGYTALTLPFTTFTYADDMTAVDFAMGGGGGGGGGGGRGRGGGQGGGTRWHCTLSDYKCSAVSAGGAPAPNVATPPVGQGRAGRGGGGQARGGGAGGGPGGAAAADQTRVSPDGKMEALIDRFNVYVRPVGRPQDAKAMSADGSDGDAYTLASIVWSPDSKKLVAYRRVPGYQRIVTWVQSSPPDQLQPKTMTRAYRKPGDEVDRDQPVLFTVETGQPIAIDRALFPTPYDISRPQWRADSRAFTFEYNQRGHQAYRVIEVNGATGRARAIIDETSRAFIDYRTVSPSLSSGRKYRLDLADGKEILWMSERDGWSHLYLYDGVTGQVKNQITRGNWAVHYVERVDEANRQIWFTANGMDAGKDPYFLHSFRINFDGTGLTRFIRGDGMHAVVWSPDRQYYVDSYSRVDMPPVSELHRTSDQSLLMELERGDITDLLATGWKPPEVFSAKGRDGATDIWGIIVRPTSFDPSKKYPIIEGIYGGPHGSFVPKTFNAEAGAAWLIGTTDMQTLAELGFIVVQIDGMGTANRSKAFHDVAWKNLGDGGFPDRILWHKAVAAKYPSYDITRVGIYGTSAGGQNAMAALLFHPEFYKAAASSAACHDNRMDKIWWNEQWMGWPIGPEYAAASNMENASKLQGRLLLIVGEMDTNVDPSSTMQVVNKLIMANKEFDLLVIPNADHTNGGAYGDHKRFDFFVRHLQGRQPPPWNQTVVTTAGEDGVGILDARAVAWAAAENWGEEQ